MRTAAPGEQAEAIGRRARWTPAYLVLYGAFCPVSDLQDALDELRGLTRADAALLLVADERAVLRTLCLSSPRDGPAGTVIDLLRTTTGSSDARGLQDLLRPATGDRDHSSRYPASLPKVVMQLARLASGRQYADTSVWLRSVAWFAPETDLPRRARTSVAVLLAGARDLKAATPRRLSALVEMVNGTAQADIRRDKLVVARVEERLTEASGGLAGAVDVLLKLAIDVSASRFGACYLLDRRAGILVATAHVPDPDGTAAYPATLVLDGNTAVAVACRRNQTVQAPPGLYGQQIIPACQPEGEDRIVELAVNVPAVAHRRAVAVLTLAKRVEDLHRDEVDAYGAYDLALLRNVALRIALRHANASTDALAAAVADSRRRDCPRQPDTHEDLGDRPTASPSTDLRTAARSIPEGLQAIAEATESHSATFRAAVPDPIAEAAHGMSLLRLAQWPDEGPDHELQRPQDGGVNWEAVTDGVARYVADVRKHPGYRPHRPESKSELSLPVLVEGRVVGVVNLESPHVDGYDDQVNLARSFAAQVALAIADARLNGTTQIQQYASRLVHGGHSLSGDLDRLRRDMPRDAGTAELLGDLSRRARGLRSFAASPDDSWAADALPDIVRRAVAEVGVPVDRVEVPTGSWPTHDTDFSTVVGQVLWNVLDNVKRHRANGKPTVLVDVSQDRWGGWLEGVVRVQNHIDPKRAAEQLHDLYRRPLHISGAASGATVPRLGAALAGRLAGSLGGGVFAAHEPERQTLTTIVAVPLAGRD